MFHHRGTKDTEKTPRKLSFLCVLCASVVNKEFFPVLSGSSSVSAISSETGYQGSYLNYPVNRALGACTAPVPSPGIEQAHDLLFHPLQEDILTELPDMRLNPKGIETIRDLLKGIDRAL